MGRRGRRVVGRGRGMGRGRMVTQQAVITKNKKDFFRVALNGKDCCSKL